MGIFSKDENEDEEESEGSGFLGTVKDTATSVKTGVSDINHRRKKYNKIEKFLGVDAGDVVMSSYQSPEDYVKGETDYNSWEKFVEEEGGLKPAKETHLDCNPQGDWVTPERLEKVIELLDDEETVHYMWRGGTIDVEGSGAGESIFGNDRDRKSSFKGIYTAVTNKRIVIAVPQVLGDDERHIPYRSVTSVDLDTGVLSRRVSLQTKGQTYHIQAQGPSKDEIRSAMKFIREKVEELHQTQQVVNTNEPDPTVQLQNLKQLHDEGVVSDEEFEKKKANLLEKI